MLVAIAEEKDFDIKEVLHIKEIYKLISKAYLYTGTDTIQNITSIFLDNPKLIISNVMLNYEQKNCITISANSLKLLLELLKKKEDKFYLVVDVSKSICEKYTIKLFEFDKHLAFPNKNPAAIRQVMINEALNELC